MKAILKVNDRFYYLNDNNTVVCEVSKPDEKVKVEEVNVKTALELGILQHGGNNMLVFKNISCFDEVVNQLSWAEIRWLKSVGCIHRDMPHIDLLRR